MCEPYPKPRCGSMERVPLSGGASHTLSLDAQCRRAGFTLVEVMIVALIIGLLAAIAIPSFSKARHEAQIARFCNDLRQIIGALERQALNDGVYPPDRMPGQPPAGITNYLTRLTWTDQTCIGGLWDWDYGQMQFGCKAGVSVHQPAWTDAQMREIDKRIDDGDLTTGHFRSRSGGYIWVIEF